MAKLLLSVGQFCQCPLIHAGPIYWGKVKITEQRKKSDWAHFTKELVDYEHPHAEKIILIMDNLNIHAGSSLYETFDPTEAKRMLDKLDIHYTPVHGSWLNNETIY